MLGVPPETTLFKLRRFEYIRRTTVHLMSFFLARMKVKNIDYEATYDEVLFRITPAYKSVTGRKPHNELRFLRNRPNLIEIIQVLIENRLSRTDLPLGTLIKVQRTVEDALPISPEDITGSFSHLADPVEDFAFVGTRFAYRTTKKMIIALWDEGYDDAGILDLAMMVAEANYWARAYRLFGLDPSLLYYDIS
jgi:hypothetical protein